MPCGYDFRDRRHSGNVPAYDSDVLVLGWGLVSRTGSSVVNSLMDLYAKFSGDLFSLGYQAQVVRPGHVREPGTEFVHVRTDQRVGLLTDMVIDDHEVSDPVVIVDSSGSIGYEQVLDPQHYHYACRHRHHIHGISFIIMDPALHHDDFLAS